MQNNYNPKSNTWVIKLKTTAGIIPNYNVTKLLLEDSEYTSFVDSLKDKQKKYTDPIAVWQFNKRREIHKKFKDNLNFVKNNDTIEVSCEFNIDFPLDWGLEDVNEWIEGFKEIRVAFLMEHFAIKKINQKRAKEIDKFTKELEENEKRNFIKFF